MNPALISLRITAIAYFFLAAVLLIFAGSAPSPIALIVISLFTVALGIAVLRVRRGLLDGKYWAWIAGIIISGMQTLSLFFPLGIMGLVGLLNKPTRQAFNSADR